MWNNWTFYNPDFLYALALVLLLWIWYYFRQREQAAQLQISSLKGITQNSWKAKGRHLLFLFRTIALAILIIAFARPQSTLSWEDMTTEGIDIVISMDISSSMLAQDLKPDRLEASKNVAMNFISGRPNDRIGLVIFSGESFTQCPLTTDHQVLQNLFANVKSGMVEDGTAIGMGLATAVNRLKESEAISKVIILLTDGVNTHGKIHPLNATEIAKEFNIRVYTIGVGTNGKAKTPVAIDPFSGKYIYDLVDVEIDEKTLKTIALETGGKYFRATDNNKLKEVYKEINELEKAKIKTIEYDIDLPEKANVFIVIGLIFLLLEFFISKYFIPSIS